MAKINVTQRKSRIGAKENQKRNLQALGLRKINHTVTLEDTPTIRGMIEKVKHLVEITEVVENKKSVKPEISTKDESK